MQHYKSETQHGDSYPNILHELQTTSHDSIEEVCFSCSSSRSPLYPKRTCRHAVVSYCSRPPGPRECIFAWLYENLELDELDNALVCDLAIPPRRNDGP
jgi:hypothetical protein